MKNQKDNCCAPCSKCFHNYATGFGQLLIGIAAVVTLYKSDGIIEKLNTILDNSIKISKQIDDLKQPDAEKLVQETNQDIGKTLKLYNQSGSSFYIPENYVGEAEKVLKGNLPQDQKILSLKKYMKVSEPHKR